MENQSLRVVPRKKRARPHEAQLHARRKELQALPVNFIYSQRGKEKISIKPLKERIRYGHRNQYQGLGVSYTEGRY